MASHLPVRSGAASSPMSGNAPPSGAQSNGRNASSLQAIRNRFKMSSMRAKGASSRRKSDIIPSTAPDKDTLHIVALNGRAQDGDSFEEGISDKRRTFASLSRPSKSTDSVASDTPSVALNGAELSSTSSKISRAASLNAIASVGRYSPAAQSDQQTSSPASVDWPQISDRQNSRSGDDNATTKAHVPPALSYNLAELGPIQKTASSSSSSTDRQMLPSRTLSQKRVVSIGAPTLVTGRAEVPSMLSGEILTRHELRKKRSISESFLDFRSPNANSWNSDLQSPESSSRNRSPLDELILGLGGRSPSAQGSSDGHSNKVGPGLPDMSPFMPAGFLAPIDQPLRSEQEQLLEDDDTNNEQFQGETDTRRNTISDTDNAYAKLRSTWSATDSARSSRATGLTRISTPEPPDVSQLLESKAASAESPVDPSVAKLKHSSLIVTTNRAVSDRDLASRAINARANGSRNVSASSRRWSIVEMEEAYQRMKDMVASAHGSQLGESMFSKPDQDLQSSSDIEQTPRLPQDMSEIQKKGSPMRARDPDISAERFWAAAANSYRSQTDDQPTPKLEADFATFPSDTEDENILMTKRKTKDDDESTPDSFVTSFSEQQARLPTPVPAPQTLPSLTSSSLYSTSTDNPSILGGIVQQYGDAKSAESPVMVPVLNRTRSATSLRNSRLSLPITSPPKLTRVRTSESVVTTTTANEGWQTPRTSVSPIKAHSSSEYINAWLPTVIPINNGSEPALRHNRSDSFRRQLREGDSPNNFIGSSSSSSHTVAGANGSLPRYKQVKYTTASREKERQRNRDSSADGASEDTATWFADTPARQKNRSRQAIPSRFTKHARKGSQTSHRSSNTPTSPILTSNTLSQFREADKIELFLKFTQTNAELEALRKQSQMEKEALLDALGETRNVVHDLRQQRNDLEEQLRRRNTSQDHSSANNERMAAVLRSKTLWQERAQSAADELERNREIIDTLRKQAKEAIDREEELTNETIFLGARVASLTAQLKDARSRVDDPSDFSRHPAVNEEEDTLVLDNEDATSRKYADSQDSSPRTPSSSNHAGQQKSRLPLNAVKTSSRMPAPRKRMQSTNDSLLSFDGVSVTGTPLLATQPAFSAETPAPIHTNNRMQTQKHKSSNSKSASDSSPPASRLPSRSPSARTSTSSPSMLPRSSNSHVPRMSASSSTHRLRSTSTQTGSTTHSRSSSAAFLPSSPISVTDFPEEHKRNTAGLFGWTPHSSNGQVGLSATDERFLAEI